MMTQARSSLISLQDTAYYHCISRCVRRAYLCGQDDYSGRNFEHRRVWLIERLRLLSQVFAIDICAYAIMSNHYHLVLHVDEKQAKSWSNKEVIERWTTLYSKPNLIQQWLDHDLVSEAEEIKALEIIKMWRSRLMDISWFMRNINEYVARQANKEEMCSGRFWEGRFKSQALLDERALLACMAYVDLNPVRAGITDKLEQSSYTSIYERLHGHACDEDSGLGQVSHLKKKSLYGFLGNQRTTTTPRMSAYNGVEYSLLDYIQLIENLGKIAHPSKPGLLSSGNIPLLNELELDDEHWQSFCDRFGLYFSCAVGSVDELKRYAQHTNRAWVRQKRSG
ncbi:MULTISPECIES: transposase [unclassified Vibrio]|uniref:Transposase n=1 Tax=Vibrio sp. HB236076 TaxID=3232307 RepID=A0AB39HBE8_9VIBR|nr:transposase [Vibrio sp. HB161653]MDP5253858.1 transposase [Vibrio sp. HB161653]